MPNSISNNIQARFISDNIRETSDKMQTSVIRLSSGERITKASDDAAGYAIGLGLKIDQSTSKAALTTAAQAGSILAIADGGISNIIEITSRIKSLAAQGNSGALGSTELGYIQNEINTLVEQIGTIVSTTKFNGTALLDGTYSNKNFQVGISESDVITLGFNALDASTLGIANLDIVNNVSGANIALDAALDTIKTTRAQVGALESRFESATKNLESSIINLSAAEETYNAIDLTNEAINLANEEVVRNAGISTLAKALTYNEALLQLLR